MGAPPGCGCQASGPAGLWLPLQLQTSNLRALPGSLFRGSQRRAGGGARPLPSPDPPAGPSEMQPLPGDRCILKSSAFLSSKIWELVGARLCLVTQSCPAPQPVDCSPPGSSVHGILQTRILEWVAMPSSRGLPDPGIEPRSPALQADSLPSGPPGGIRTTPLSTEEKSPQSSTQFKPSALGCRPPWVRLRVCRQRF